MNRWPIVSTTEQGKQPKERKKEEEEEEEEEEGTSDVYVLPFLSSAATIVHVCCI
jgi:hypothetical protein